MIFKTKSKLKNLSFILGSFVFFLSGIDAVDQKNLLLAISNLLMAVVNFSAIYTLKQYSFWMDVILFIMNSVLASMVAYFYFNEGKKGLPYAWIFVCAFYLAAAFITYKKGKIRIQQT